MKLKTALQIFGGISVVLTLFRFVALDYWWVRIFDFPHIQLTILSVVAFLLYFIKFDIKWRNDYIFASILLVCSLLQLYRIYPYTPIHDKEIGSSSETEKTNSVSFFTANVLQENKKMNLLVEQVNLLKPDILLFTETNKDWVTYLNANLSNNYKYRVEKPLDNTYGMVLYSKLPLQDTKVIFQVSKDIPSIEAKLMLPSNNLVQLYCIHPTPPMPQHNPMSTERDAEMMLTSRKSRESTLPVVVMGDFNDVPWSRTTQLFKETSGLLDPRIGRSPYNSYNANNILFRWPLDHIFLGPEFRVQKIKIGDDINSDHFPLYLQCTFEPKLAEKQKPEPPTKKQLERAEDQIKGVDVLTI